MTRSLSDHAHTRPHAGLHVPHTLLSRWIVVFLGGGCIPALRWIGVVFLPVALPVRIFLHERLLILLLVYGQNLLVIKCC